MLKCSVIFHSVCGNSYFMADRFYSAFEKLGVDCRLFRVADDDLVRWGDLFPVASEVLDRIESIPMASPENMFESDIVVLGCPTYFGNVSAEMKCYMDSACMYWMDAMLSGKVFGAFTSASNPVGGGDVCLRSLVTFAQHMGMVNVSLPCNICPGVDVSAYGAISFSGAKGDKRPSDLDYRVIDAYSGVLVNSR